MRGSSTLKNKYLSKSKKWDVTFIGYHLAKAISSLKLILGQFDYYLHRIRFLNCMYCTTRSALSSHTFSIIDDSNKNGIINIPWWLCEIYRSENSRSI